MVPGAAAEAGVSSKPKAKMTPAEQQAAMLSKLMANPDKQVKIPSARPEEKQIRPPKEMMKNVAGSSAGAGSGEFHVYKHARRREYERVKIMEETDQKQKEKQQFEEAKAAREAELESKTSKNKSRRDKRKAAKQSAKGVSPAVGNQSSAVAAAGGNRDADGVEQQSGQKRRRVAPGAATVAFSRPGEGSEEEE